MPHEEENVKYPQNIYLRGLVAVSGKSVGYLAREVGVSRKTLSQTINGHYKGDNVVPKLIELINSLKIQQPQNPQNHETF